MTYNFDEIIDRRGTNASKWEPSTLKNLFGEEDLLPFWIADMEFKVAQPIIDAIVRRAEHGIYGYTIRPDSYYDSIINWTKKRFNWDIKREWIEFTPGIVPAINYMIQALCQPGDKVIIQQPVYYPFANAVRNNGCHVLNNELIFNGENYEIDFDDFEAKAKDPKAKVFLLCSPHNPVGRVWTKEELIKIGDICLENDVIVIADEIHNDLVFIGYKHFIFGSLGEKYADNCVVCTAPSKTFNLAGMFSSNIIIPNTLIRDKYKRILEKNAINGQNPLSIIALEAAYNEGEEWLEELLKYLEGNIQYINDYLAKHLPKAKMITPQATYLGWIDFREYEKDGKKLENLMVTKGKVAMDGGTWFGDRAEGFMRINFACPRSLLQQGLERISTALS